MAEAARAAASATATAEATAAAVAAAAAGEVGRDDVAAPEWLNPLMKTVLPDFHGTRYARSRLKQTLVRMPRPHHVVVRGYSLLMRCGIH